MIYGELGACPMSVYIKLGMVYYWSKLTNGKDSKLSLILYKYMYIKNLHGQYQSSWFDNVKSILDNCGFSNIWESQGNIRPKQFIYIRISENSKLNIVFRICYLWPRNYNYMVTQLDIGKQ